MQKKRVPPNYIGKLEQALIIFEEILKINKSDKAVQFYIERCKKYIKNGIPKNWSAIQAFNT